MSAALYCRRVCWDGLNGRGIAKALGVTVEMHAPPPGFINTAEIDYGEVHLGCAAYDPIIRDRACDPRRDMTPRELAALRAWLASLSAAFAAFTGGKA